MSEDKTGKSELQPPAKEESFIYRGIEINGLDFLEENDVLAREDVTELIDRLPIRFFSEIPLGIINFVQYKLFSVKRNKEVIYVKENELLPSDEIIARKRGNTRWNHELIDGKAVATDGRLTITIFSPLNWNDKQDKQLDKDTAFYTLGHELGHAIYTTITDGTRIFDGIAGEGKSVPCNKGADCYLPFIERWKQLPESNLADFREYKQAIAEEFKRDLSTFKEGSLEELFAEEDFAISYGHFLYWQGLKTFEEQRHALHQALYEVMND